MTLSNVCKGTSIGSNFTLAVPYAQLAHFRELNLAEANRVPRHIVRISAGGWMRQRKRSIVSGMLSLPWKLSPLGPELAALIRI